MDSLLPKELNNLENQKKEENEETERIETGNKQKPLKSILSNTNPDKLEVNDIINAVKTAIVDITELEITTWVAESNTRVGEEQENRVETAKPGNRIYTMINLVDGNISNEIGSQFVGNGPYAELLEFHLSQVKESREIIQKNIETVHKIYGILMELYKSRKN
ncbi:MAG: hypothetical protein RMX96_04210 [Nostoc sp. ChiSLP02]|nr:hypothetical protein [Nostoc sp. DedSLP05]MDZ8098135.1 hypothetical protein [Nostoc sp. DedSLP01]MDZ8184051.1 hypothetical protein [Nostoc sp. ChiSLP02]